MQDQKNLKHQEVKHGHEWVAIIKRNDYRKSVSVK